MTKLYTVAVLFVIVALFSQCATKKSAGTASASTDAAKVAAIKKEFTPEQIAEGKTIWQTSCSKCHKLFEPETRTVAKWETILPNMSMRAKLDETKAAKVRAYVLSNAKLG